MLVLVAVASGLVLGYHPYAEDGGIYLAEIKKVLDPGLYPFGGEFVRGHLGGVPGFVDGVAWLVRVTGWRLDWVMLGLHLVCLGAMLAGVWRLASRCYAGAAARWGAVGVMGLCCGMPVAGTSLMLVDPYVTARSVSLAGTVLGLAGVAAWRMDGGWGRIAWVFGMLGIAVAAHPLMGGYGVGAAVVLACLLSERRVVRVGGLAGIAAAAVIVAGVVQSVAPVETTEYGRVAATRYYWFLAEWHWYEWMGLAAPLVILAWVGWRAGGVLRGLAWTGVCVGGISVAVAGVFAHEGGRVHAVARLQPLRCFQVVYVVMLVVLGGWLGDRVLRGMAWRWGLALVGLGGLMGFVQAQTYPASRHLELPGVASRNGWEEAFVWTRDHTPRDAVFALDADYVHRPGEDAQGFRAIAERSVLPDYSKDGGQAAIRPELTDAWVVGQTAQARLSEETDEERRAKLEGLGVSWVVLERGARTGLPCLYANAVVMVCEFTH